MKLLFCLLLSSLHVYQSFIRQSETTKTYTATSFPFHSSYLLPLYLTLNDISWGPSSSDHTIGQCLSLTVHVCQLSFLLLQLLLEVGGLCAQRIHRVLTSINPQSLRCHFPPTLMFIPGSVHFSFAVEDGSREFGLCVEPIKKYAKIYALLDERP